MLKYTNKHHQDHELLSKALNQLGLTLQDHNKGIDPSASDHAHKLLAVANSIANVEEITTQIGNGLVSAGRRFVKEGAVSVKQKAKLGQRSKSMKVASSKLKQISESQSKTKPYIFLFNDVVLHCEQISQKSKDVERPFVFANALQLVHIKEVQTVEKEPRAFRLLRVNGTFWKLKAKSTEECQEWMSVIRQYVARINGPTK